MIKTMEGFRSTKEALGHLERALDDVKNKRSSMHPQWYAIMSEPIEEDIAKLRAEIADFESRRPNMPATATDSSPVSDVA